MEELQAEERRDAAGGRVKERRGPITAASMGSGQGRERMVKGRAAWMAPQKMKGQPGAWQ